MNNDTDRLYNLLPTMYRLRDVERGEPLRALLSVIDEQVAVLEEDLAQLYDDLFAETCASWALPYIGDLIGYRALYGVTTDVSNPRAEVANTVAFRRRKGTASVLEEMARSVTGWPARVAELRDLLATTQYLNHLRPTHRVTPDLRQIESLERLRTPFNRLAHTADVRRIDSERGVFNIPNIAIFLWRLRRYPITTGTAKQIAPGCFTFHPLGFDTPLFNAPRSEAGITSIAEPINVPAPLRRRPLYHELEALRQALADGRTAADALAKSVSFGTDPVFQIFTITGGARTAIPPAEIMICDLSDPPTPLPTHWRRPAATQQYQPADLTQPAVSLSIQIAVDPVLGRLAFATDPTAERVEVSYSYGFSAEIGGGPYTRALPAATTVVPDEPAAALGALANVASRIIEIPGSLTLSGDLTITLSAGQELQIQAESGERPVLDGVLTIVTADGAKLTVDGLLIAKGIRVTGTATTTLVLRDCTIPPSLDQINSTPQPPASPAIDWSVDGSRGTLLLDRTIGGRLLLSAGIAVTIQNSIIDALADDAVTLAASADGAAEAGRLTMRSTTVIGGLHVREVELIENSIITGAVRSDRTQAGCVRYTFLPPTSIVPRRYACQPNHAVQQALDTAKQLNPSLPTAEAARIEADVLARVRPIFTDSIYGRPAYIQLARACAAELRTGADDESELGAFHDEYQARRETNLRIRLDEYLRFGLEAGIFFAS